MPGFLQRVRPSSGVRGAVLFAALLVAFMGCGDVMHQGPGGDLEDSADGLFDGHLSDQEVNPGDANPGDVALDGGDATLDADAQLDSQSDVAETAGNEAPSLEFLKPTEGAFVQVGMAVAVSLHVADDGGAANVTVEIALQGASAVLFSGVAPADGNIAADLPGLQAGVQTLVATATDAQGKATAVVRKLYVNTAPGAAVVLIEPATPTTLDELQAVVVTEAADIDRAANLLTYQYMWMRDGELTAFIGASVPALTAKRGETWMVKVFAADPYSQGAPGEASVVIDDAAPSTPTVALDKLQCDLATEISCTILQPSLDADGDAVTYTYHWYVNGAEDPSATADHVLVATLQSATGPIEQGSKIQCVVMASDGTKTSAAAASGELTVGVLDVCASPLNPCSPLASCQGSTTLSVVCTCKSGYDGNGLVCTDIDECAINTDGCAENAVCGNLAGTFQCTCKAGYIGSGASCTDIDECLQQSDNCADTAVCNNTPGSFTCACKPGYAGNGTNCTDIDECAAANGGCGDALYFTCENQLGQPVKCADIDECALANGGCDIHADCTNKLAAAAVCTCKAGFAMVGGVCVGNTPEASSVGFGGASGCLAIGYSLYQAQELPVSATVQYSVGNSGLWLSATPASGGDGLTQLATGAVKPGKSHVFLWNSSVDIAGDATSTSKNVSFRVIPSLGAVVGLPGMATGVVHTGFALQTPSLVAVGPKPRAVMTGDVNRDGKPDLLAVNSNGSGPGSVSVRLGNGLGQFTNGAAVAVGNGPLHGVIADFNRDGKLDWAVANFSGGAAGSLSIALGNGDGTFQAITSLATGAGPAYVATADLNLDGLPDLGVANVVGGTVTLFIGKGDGSFTASAVAAGPTGGIAFADLNEDGKADLVSATAGNVVQVRPGAGDGSFGAAISQGLSVPGTIQDLVVADWNRDGHLDVLACSTLGDSLAILLGDGKGGLLPVTQTAIANTTSYRALEVGDFNQDGNPDVALGGTGSAMGLSLYLGTGGPGSSGGHSATTGGIWDLAVADFNLDGVSDFAAAVDGLETVAVVLGQLPLRCDWALELPVTYVSATGTTGLTAADLNHDGIVDLVSANAGNGTVGTLLGKPDGVFATPAVLTSSGANTSAVVSGDFNRDGSLDVASVNSASSMGTISVLMTVNGGPGFAAAVSIDACPGAKGLVSADFNRDGYLDLATTCTTQFAVLLGKANGSFAPALLTPLAGSPQGIATGDFNRDGIADLAFALFGSTAVSVQLGKGDGTFTAISPIPAGTGGGLWSLGSGDFNHDGAADLLVVAESAGTFRLLMGKGDGTFAPAVAVAVEASKPHHAVLVDLNSDGNLDFVVGYYGTGHLGVYLGDGKGGFALHTLYSGIEGGAFDSIIAGDFDRDGRIDIAVAMGGVNNKIAVFLQGQQGCQNQGPAVVLLGSAGNFVALAKAAISSVPTSVVTGNIGVSPAAASYITGFSLVADSTNVFSTATQVAGKVFAANYAVPSPANMTTAIADMELAYVDAAGRPNPDHLELGAGEIGGLTLKAGLYKWTSTVKISEHLVLSGCASDVWILQTSGDLTMASAKKVILSGGAQAKNVFWQVAGQATIGAGAHFEGVILAKTGITLETGASMNGRALAQTAVALQQATLSP